MSHRLKDLRQAYGLTQKQMATLLDCTQAALSQIENRRRSNSEVFDKARSRFNLPADFFDVPPAPYSSSALNYRTYRVPVKTQDAFSVTFYEAERTLLTQQHEAPTLDIQAHDLPRRASALPIAMIDDIALRTRDTLGLNPTGPVMNVTRCIEQAGHRVCTIENRCVDISKIDGASSPVFNENGQALVATTVSNDGGRVRFTRAHEFGHLVLHTSQRPDDERVRETEAHLFAGAFLMPEADARKEITEHLTLEGYAQLKARYAMSMAALITRAHKLNIISANRYRSLFTQLSSRGWRKNEPVTVPVENSSFFSFPHAYKPETKNRPPQNNVIHINFH